MKRRPIWFAIIGIPLLIIALKYGKCCVQEKSFAQEKVKPNLPEVFIAGFEAGVRYGVATHLMKPDYKIKQIMSYAKNWFVYNQIADSTETIPLPTKKVK